MNLFGSRPFLTKMRYLFVLQSPMAKHKVVFETKLLIIKTSIIWTATIIG